MRARVKADYRWRTMTACAGAEFVKGEYRRVPAGRELEAERNPFLEIEPVEEQPVPEPEKAAESPADDTPEPERTSSGTTDASRRSGKGKGAK